LYLSGGALRSDCRDTGQRDDQGLVDCRPAQAYTRWSCDPQVVSRFGVWPCAWRSGGVGVGVLLVGAAGPAGGASASAPQGTLVFASNRTGVFQIYSIRADGRQLGQLTRGKAADTAPRFSPDGRRIVFTRSPKQYMYEPWVMNADGSGQRRLTRNGGVDADPSWSRNGRRIVFESKRDGAFGIYVMQADGREQRRLTEKGREGGDPAWSPDGQRIAFVRRGDLYVMHADGSGQRRLTRKRGEDAFPGWLPARRIRAG
jgi:Tol biopolymer transport system component